MEHEDLIVSMKGIQKSFGGVHALTDGELTLRKGEVLGLIGENGAGKSTLMKILSGVYQADAGVMLVDGKEVHYHEPRQALHDGICMIYQELNLVQHTEMYTMMSWMKPFRCMRKIHMGQPKWPVRSWFAITVWTAFRCV